MRINFVLPLPRFVLHPLTAASIGAVHVYLAYGHLSKLMAGQVEWTNIWKGFGALFGAYVFAALAARRIAESLKRKENAVQERDAVSVPCRPLSNPNS